MGHIARNAVCAFFGAIRIQIKISLNSNQRTSCKSNEPEPNVLFPQNRNQIHNERKRTKKRRNETSIQKDKTQKFQQKLQNETRTYSRLCDYLNEIYKPIMKFNAQSE